jgi:hypothetical protein
MAGSNNKLSRKSQPPAAISAPYNWPLLSHGQALEVTGEVEEEMEMEESSNELEHEQEKREERTSELKRDWRGVGVCACCRSPADPPVLHCRPLLVASTG